MDGHLFDSFFLIFSGAAVIASLALYTRQPIIVAYIAIGILLGPFGLKAIDDIAILTDMSHVGIIFLLFLMGLDMQPSALKAVLKKATSVALISSAAFAALGYCLGYAFGFTHMESLVIAMTMMFSSTIIGIKLMPTTVLHHRHSGELMVGLLLLQDFLAILCLMILFSSSANTLQLGKLGAATLALPLLGGFAFVFVKYILIKLISRFDRFHEYIFLVALGWCLGLAKLAEAVNLSAEIGAFIAGVSLATSPISQYIALSLKPLRDFFLILFFFALGAQLNITLLPTLWLPILVTSVVVLAAKPMIFYLLLRKHAERRSLAWDVGFRLGQMSEFSLLVIFVALEQALIGDVAALLIQAAAIVTFIASSYVVTLNFPNPIAINDRLRRD